MVLIIAAAKPHYNNVSLGCEHTMMMLSPPHAQKCERARGGLKFLIGLLLLAVVMLFFTSVACYLSFTNIPHEFNSLCLYDDYLLVHKANHILESGTYKIKMVKIKS